jgi:hypothetical protein
MTDKERAQLSGADWPINAFETSGVNLAEILNRFEDVVMTTNAGSSRPAEAKTGTLWVSTAGNVTSLYLYDGSTDHLIGSSDGLGPDSIDLSALLTWLESNLDYVKSFNGRDGQVVPADGDYKIAQMGDYGSSNTYTANHAIVADGSQFKLTAIANSFKGRTGAVVPTEGDYNLTDMGDVGLSGLVKDDYLQWNGSSWENNPPKLIETELNFMGGYDITQQPPANPGHGDLYINNKNGTAASGWTGIAGLYVNVGNAVGYSANHNANGDQVAEGTGGAWFLLGEVFTGGILGVGAGQGISVDNSDPTEPVVSVNKGTLDGWYALTGHKHDDLYATIGHNHAGVYQPVGNYLTSADLSGYATQSWVSTNYQPKGSYAAANHTHDYAASNHSHDQYELKYTKNSAWNKNFGSQRDEVARGDHTHDYLSELPSHTHPASQISAGTFGSGQYTFPSHVYIGGYCEVTSVVRSYNDVIAYYSSDERLKDNVKPIESALDKLLTIRGVTFEWNGRQANYQGQDIGVIAQDVMKAFPSLVEEQGSGFLGVKYEKLIAPAIEAIRELSEELRKLKAEVAELKGAQDGAA